MDPLDTFLHESLVRDAFLEACKRATCLMLVDEDEEKSVQWETCRIVGVILEEQG